MLEAVEQALKTTLHHWNKMKGSSEEEAEDEANQFEASFYKLMEEVRMWFNRLDNRPSTVEDALELPDIIEITEALPAELYLNFETELDLIVDGKIREEDEKYD
ncbi:hypothetical protein [Brevibacillus migulae]|uniref:hypothetical protein n=1 Tax=Brevibacillus migulae TaxID=1644114 RepID=UPI00106E08C3|nr:hypothetical protein [Brevibacillus migulae]